LTRERLVIDASAAIRAALSVTETPALGAYELCAPPLFLSERTSAVSAAAFRGAIGRDAAWEAFDRLEAMPVTIIDDGTVHRREALEFAATHGWAKTYDAEYVVLARRLACRLLTTDARLIRRMRSTRDLFFDAGALGAPL
jgi:predicted nucleic acid-binding protein